MGCRAAHCEHTHSRRLAAAADREPCPAYQGFCCLVLVLPVCTSSVPQGLILKAAACCHVWCPAGKQFAMCWSLPVACWHLLCTCHPGERRLVAPSSLYFSLGNNSRDVF